MTTPTTEGADQAHTLAAGPLHDNMGPLYIRPLHTIYHARPAGTTTPPTEDAHAGGSII